MSTKQDVLQEDLVAISQVDYIPWDKLKEQNILITGGTGLVGSTIIKALCYASTVKNLQVKIFALVRNLEKAEQILGHENESLHFIKGSVENLPAINVPVDYIIHGASPTASLFFVQHPVETIQIAVKGTSNLLELAREKVVKGFVYLSSMEVYGAPQADTLIPESHGCTLDSMTVRSCYPIAKRLCENLCASYAQEYHVPAKVIRLAQTIGPGVSKEDKRVFAEFARDAMEGKNIVLQTNGASKREYLYTADAVTAILTVLLCGQNGEAYNAGNPKTYCSIVEMAKIVAQEIGKNKIQVIIQSNNFNNSKFPPSHHLYLDTNKMAGIGWIPSKNLLEMYSRMIESMKG